MFKPKNEYKRLWAEDTEGNIESLGLINSKTEQVNIGRKKNKLTPRQKALLTDKSELTLHSEKLGGYIHMYYIKNELLFNELNIDRANISRLVYLATYIDYNDRKENLLVKYGQFKGVVPMTKKDIKEKMKLSDATFSVFFNEMKKKNLIYEVNNKLYINPDYFNRGKNQMDKKGYTRVFIDTTRMLYENCSSRQHKQLSYVFQLIPYMNYELNIICSNPDEPDFYELDKLGLKRICELLGISTDKKSMNTFEKNLLKFYISYEDKKYYLFKRVIVKGGNGKFDYFVINPYVTWKGKSVYQIKDIIQACFFGKEGVE